MHVGTLPAALSKLMEEGMNPNGRVCMAVVGLILRPAGETRREVYHVG